MDFEPNVEVCGGRAQRQKIARRFCPSAPLPCYASSVEWKPSFSFRTLLQVSAEPFILDHRVTHRAHRFSSDICHRVFEHINKNDGILTPGALSALVIASVWWIEEHATSTRAFKIHNNTGTILARRGIRTHLKTVGTVIRNVGHGQNEP